MTIILAGRASSACGPGCIPAGTTCVTRALTARRDRAARTVCAACHVGISAPITSSGIFVCTTGARGTATIATRDAQPSTKTTTVDMPELHLLPCLVCENKASITVPAFTTSTRAAFCIPGISRIVLPIVAFGTFQHSLVLQGLTEFRIQHCATMQKIVALNLCQKPCRHIRKCN